MNKRNSSLELLRIILMFNIVLNHLNIYSMFNVININENINNLLITICKFGNLSVDIFFMIMGFFCIEKKFNIKKIIKLELEGIFYSLLIYFIVVLFFDVNFSFKTLIVCILPTITGQYWFLTAYIVVYLLSPLVNYIFDKLNIKFILVMDLMTMFTCFLLIVYNVDSTFITMADCFAMYILGALIKRLGYKPNIKKCLLVIITVSIITSIVVMVLNNSDDIINIVNKLQYRTSPINIILAIYIFCLFLNFDFYNSFINKTASNVFAVYLIHESRLLRNIIWNKIFRLNRFITSPALPIYAIGTCLIIMVVCIAIEEIRKFIFSKTIDKLIA